MAFLYTFAGMLLAGTIWMGLFIAFGESADARLRLIADWLSPEAVTGWIVFFVLCVVCSWLMYRLMRSRLSDDR